MKNTLLFLFLTLCSGVLLAQKGTVRGNIYDKITAEPVSFASVGLEGTQYGTTTDLNGFFSVSNVPSGKYNLVVTFLGYDKYTVAIEIPKGEIIYQNIFINESSAKIGEVTITGKKEQARTQTQVSKLTVTPKQIRSLPSAGGEADIAQYLTVLPGVIFTGDQGGQLYIRGGSPVQNRIMLDGMTLYNPFHSIGFFSVFETELIRNVDVYTGGFNSEYGGRVSAIVDVKTREGNRKKLAGLASVSPFQAKAMIEGPIIKLKDDNGSSISYVVTGKKSLIEKLDRKLYPNINDTTGIPFSYTDIYGKLSMLTGNGSKLNLFGFNYDDKVNFPNIKFGWVSQGAGMDFTLIPTNSNTIVSGVFTFSNYNSDRIDGSGEPRTSSVGGYTAALNFSNFGRNSEFKYGLELNGFKTTFEFVNFKKLSINQDQNTTEIATYLKYKQKLGNLIIEPGFRLQYYASLSDVSPEPRLGLKYNVSNNIRFKGAAGLYSQNLLSTVDERDIVNLFVGFLSGPESTIYEPGSTENKVKHRLQKSAHAVAGFEFDLFKNIELNVEGYYKKFTQLLAINRNKTIQSQPDYVKETGDAKGIDFSAKWEGKRAYFWGTYSLGKVTRDDGEQVYPPVFDRRHNVNTLFTYQAGKKEEWELGIRWNLGSGFPFTLTQGFYENYSFQEGIGTDIPTENPDLGIVFADERNGGRLPYYHRLDISVKRTFKFSKDSKMELNASATNVYDRKNIFYFDRVKYDRVNQLPFLPSMSMTIEF
jgi:hypothetical protein